MDAIFAIIERRDIITLNQGINLSLDEFRQAIVYCLNTDNKKCFISLWLTYDRKGDEYKPIAHSLKNYILRKKNWIRDAPFNVCYL